MRFNCRTTYLCLFSIIFLSGCATVFNQTGNQPSQQFQKLIKENPESFVERSILGVYVIENHNKEIEIYNIAKQSIAAKADVRIGDVIVSVDNMEIKNRSELFSYIYERKNPGGTIEIVLKRNNNLLTRSITPKTHHVFKDAYALLYEIVENDNEPISLAIVVDSVNNVYLQGAVLEQWETGMKALLINSWENYYLSFFAPERYFNLIDRGKVDNVLNEQKLQYSGSINTETQQELGEMLGASHLLIIDYSRFYVSNVEALDIETHKLIEIKSGKVLASISLRSKVQYVQH